MKYEIEYEESVIRINTVTIEVEDEDEGKIIANMLDPDSWRHPDDVLEDFKNLGVTVLDEHEGAESIEYEIF